MMCKQTVILLLFSLILVASKKIVPEQETNLSLLSFMSRSNSLMQRDPTRSVDCFDYYLPLIDQIAKKYQENYGACIQQSEDGRSQAEAATLEKRQDLSSRAENSCNLLSKCSEINAADKVFECFVEGGSENGKTMYSINADASGHLSDLLEEFRLINNKEYKCTNETKRIYEQESLTAYSDLSNCILGISEIPTPTEAPVETEPPVETERPVETEAPESTEDPESSEEAQNSEDKLPEEDISLLRNLLKASINKLRY